MNCSAPDTATATERLSTVPCAMPDMLHDDRRRTPVNLRAPKVPNFTGIFEERNPEARDK